MMNSQGRNELERPDIPPDSVTDPGADNGAPDTAVPLVVDVDDTLLSTDLLVESFLALLASAPTDAFRALLRLRGGKADLKIAIADRIQFDWRTMPFDEDVLALIEQARRDGRPVYLASASDARLVQSLADHLGGIAGTFGTSGKTNLSGRHKAAALTEAFGERGFDYVGDTTVDRGVWAKARRAILARPKASLLQTVKAEHTDVEVVGRRKSQFAAYLKALRPHQWFKNVLVFLAPLAAHHLDAAALIAALAAFVAISLCASSAYLLNDLLDLPSDRRHPKKRNRPFARGALPLVHGIALSPILLVLGLLTAAAVNAWLFGVVCVYVVSTLLYSLWLKRLPVVDIMVLGGLYTLRIFAGAVAVGVALSPWLLMFSLFLFLCLGVVKRYAELVDLSKRELSSVPGRGYSVEDLPVVIPFAVGAGFAAVMVVALYLNSDAVTALYERPQVMWLICPLLLYWVSRVIMITHRGQMHDDPVVFALTDRVSIAVGALCLGVGLAAGPL